MSAAEKAGGVEDSAIRILIVEDHAIVRAGLRMLLENQPSMRVVLEASSVSEVRRQKAVDVDIILLDLDLGEENGFDFITELLCRFAGARILILTATTDMQVHLAAISSGASGIVIKDQAPETLLKAIQGVHLGEAWMNRSLMAAVVGQFSKARQEPVIDPEAAKIGLLTPREKEVVSLITEGYSGSRIAAELRISEGTVRNHLTSILAKLELANRFELAVYAFRHGLGAPTREL